MLNGSKIRNLRLKKLGRFQSRDKKENVLSNPKSKIIKCKWINNQWGINHQGLNRKRVKARSVSRVDNICIANLKQVTIKTPKDQRHQS
jgi:hypothetical protein